MQLLVQLSIILLFFSVRGHKIFQNETLNGLNGTSLDLNNATFVNLKNNNDEFTTNMTNNNTDHVFVNSPESHQNTNFNESDLIRIVLRDKPKIINEQAESTDFKELPECSAYKDFLKDLVAGEKLTDLSLVGNKEEYKSSIFNSEAGLRWSDSILFKTMKNYEILKGKVGLLKQQEELNNSSNNSSTDLPSNFNLTSNLQLVENNAESSASSSFQPVVKTTNLSANLQQDNKQKYRTHDLNNIQQFWTDDNSMKTINVYNISHKPSLNSMENNQNSNIVQTELIEIVLKEASEKEANKLPEGVLNQNVLTDETNISQQQDGKDLILLQPTVATNDTNSTTEIFKNVAAGIQNFSTENNVMLEEQEKSSKDSQVDSNTTTSTILNDLNGEVSNKVTNIKELEEEIYLIPSELVEEITPATSELSTKPLNSFKEDQQFGIIANDPKEEALKKVVNLSKSQEENNFVTKETFEELKLGPNTPPNSNGFEATQHFNDTVNSLKEAVLLQITNPDEIYGVEYRNRVKPGTPIKATIVVINQMTVMPKKSLQSTQNFNTTEKEIKANLSSTSSSMETNSNSKAVTELKKQEIVNNFKEPQNSQAIVQISTIIDNRQESLEENKIYLAELDTSSTPEEQDEGQSQTTPKSLLTVEEYAVKQMNFILDHLLLETQTFVAKVLQATINSVFPRDHLKLYAEGVNNILNPIAASDYSDEIFENIKTESQDEIYEQIMQKLKFLKNKPSKYLEQQIPPEWLSEFHETRLELAIWLDKAAEQMHKEFMVYITEADDPIKFQYFNETFDDISRATEIHHKLAFLADLVKIVTNKKQITFMDLYMQN